jgi:hypothetical protein
MPLLAPSDGLNQTAFRIGVHRYFRCRFACVRNPSLVARSLRRDQRAIGRLFATQFATQFAAQFSALFVL